MGKKRRTKTPKPELQNTQHLAANIAGILVPNGTSAAFGATTEQERIRMAKNIMASALATLGSLVLVKIPLDILYVDLMYQRFRHKDILNLVKDYSVDTAKAIEVSYRESEGRFYIIDGLHRVIAAIINGHDYILAFVYTGRTQAEEAEIFRFQNKGRITLKPIDDYKAGLTAGHADCLALSALTEKYNLSIGSKRAGAAAQLNSIQTALDIINTPNGVDILDWMFQLMRDTKWFNDSQALNAKFMNNFVVAYNNAVCDDMLDIATERLRLVMSAITPTKFSAYAQLHYDSPDKRGYTMSMITDVVKGHLTTSSII